MAKRRKKILGVPIGPPQPSRAERLARTGLPIVGLAAAAVGAATLARKSRADGQGDGDAQGAGSRGGTLRPRRAGPDPSSTARSARAKMQRQLKAGRIDLERAFSLADEEEALGRTRVKVLLQSLPGVGPQGAVNAMQDLGIDPSRRIKGLGSHQRAELIDRFPGTG